MKTRMLSLMAALLILPSCALVFPGHPDSEAREGEIVSLTFKGKPPQVLETKGFTPSEALGGAAVGAAVGFVVDYVGKELDKESERYEASFGVTTCLVARGGQVKVNDVEAKVFGLEVPGEGKIYTAGTLELRRSVKDGAAASYVFALEGDSGATGAFRVVLRKVDLKRVRAKVFDGTWKRGWLTRVLLYGFLADLGAIVHNGYGDDAIDVNVSMVVEVDAVSESKVIEKRRIASLEWVLQDVPFGIGTCPLDVNQDGGWITLPAIGSTPISITVTVEEADEFGPLVGKASQILKKYRDKIVDLADPK